MPLDLDHAHLLSVGLDGRGFDDVQMLRGTEGPKFNKKSPHMLDSVQQERVIELNDQQLSVPDAGVVGLVAR